MLIGDGGPARWPFLVWPVWLAAVLKGHAVIVGYHERLSGFVGFAWLAGVGRGTAADRSGDRPAAQAAVTTAALAPAAQVAAALATGARSAGEHRYRPATASLPASIDMTAQMTLRPLLQDELPRDRVWLQDGKVRVSAGADGLVDAGYTAGVDSLLPGGDLWRSSDDDSGQGHAHQPLRWTACRQRPCQRRY